MTRLRAAVLAAMSVTVVACETDDTPPPVLTPVVSPLESGQAALRLGDYTRAAADCRKASEDPNPPPVAFACLGDAERGLGRRPQAEIAWQAYVERVPNDVPRRHGLAKFYIEDGRFTQAQVQLDRVSQLGLATAETFFLVAEIFRLQGNCNAALGNYRQSLRIDPNYAPAHEMQDRARREICPRPAPVRRVAPPAPAKPAQ
ncbi:tetratricopeptide repeat protein [Stella sp.]|uniref:tetratricopeptide repeat protein n=1 Tax=Stella sp. TaxID=2912054 RepID=UPI0035B04DC5